MPGLGTRSYVDYLRYVMASVLGAAGLCVAIATCHWPLVWDAQVLHYGNFLIERGFAPYRDIIEMNMPGAYLIEGWAMHVFGAGDLGWRIYDFALLGSLCLAMVVIARSYDWLAGLFAAVMFAVVHVSEGPQNAGQRDEVMTVLIMAGYAFLFESLRRRKPWMMVAFGLSLGMGSSIKPTVAPLGALLIVLAVWDLRKRGERVAAYVWNSLLGALIAATIVIAFLWHHHATGAFLAITRKLTPYYAGMDHLSFHLMLRFSLPLAAFLLLPFAVAVACTQRQGRNWEQWAILLGAAFGGFSYFVQHKGYSYHRYTFMAFALLWIALELTSAMRRPAWVNRLGLAGMAVGSFLLVPIYVQQTLRLSPPNLFTPALESDLSSMGTDRLQGKVQCLDLVDGCFNALYHLRVVQSTGWMGDLLLFVPEKSPVIDYYRGVFWTSLTEDPPSVIVLTNEWFNRVPTFDKLNEWPQFARYLDDHYSMVLSREFDEEAHHAYRIYVRNGVSFPSLQGGAPQTVGQNRKMPVS